MATDALELLMKQASALPVDEQLRLAAYLVEQARAQYANAAATPLRWRDIRGTASPSLLGEDAQTWVTRTRHEADEGRERALRGNR